MSRPIPPLPGVDPATSPTPDDPRWEEWYERVAISPEGVDRMLIWQHLHRTPTERLAVLQRVVNDLLEMRGGRWPELP